MCQDEWCYCRSICDDACTEMVADAFVDIFEATWTIAEEAKINKELGIGTDPQS